MNEKKENKSAIASILEMTNIDEVESSNSDDANIDKPKQRSTPLSAAATSNMETITRFRVNPSRCRVWKHNRRIQKHDEELISSIRSQKQINPAIVRVIKNDPDYDYEIILGSRRHYTCEFLNIDFLIEVRNLTDREAITLSWHDNKDREGFCDYEDAVTIQEALNDIYENNQTVAAKDFNVSTAKMSKMIALANLDKVFIQAFPDIKSIKLHHAQDIRSITKQSVKFDLVKNEALRIAALSDDAKPADASSVIKLLKRAALDAPVVTKKHEPLTFNSQKDASIVVASAKQTSKGEVVFTYNPKSGASKTEIVNALKAAIAKFDK